MPMVSKSNELKKSRLTVVTMEAATQSIVIVCLGKNKYSKDKLTFNPAYRVLNLHFNLV